MSSVDCLLLPVCGERRRSRAQKKTNEPRNPLPGVSITAVNLTDGIRVDQATQKGSIYDVISVVTKANLCLCCQDPLAHPEAVFRECDKMS